MMSKEKFLKAAFNQAVNQVDISRVSPELNETIIRTGIQAYADRKGVSCTNDEIDQTIEKGLAVLKSAGEDYRYQDWSMLR